MIIIWKILTCFSSFCRIGWRSKVDIYKCPVCQSALIRKDKHYICNKGHNFDIAEKCYVNLLLGNQKKTKDPGDNKEMMESRKSFLNREYYSKFSQGLNETIVHFITEKQNSILDAGCGEGYFISMLKNALIDNYNMRNIDYYGVDISKSAIRYASKRDKAINLAVSSNFNLPILDNSINVIIRNFAPGDNKEFHRVLTGAGKLIIVTPGEEHLYELKEVLYEKARKHDNKEMVAAGFRFLENREIKYRIHIDIQEDIRNLISMTPYYWSISEETRRNMNEIKALTTTLHFNIDVYCKE
jgi:23S rRNA (guanine745-N1)-methyltransferase